MKSSMQHSFAQVPQVKIPRSVFNRSHCHKSTFNAGELIPIYVDEALPGDTFNLRATVFARLTTPIVPFMDNVYLDTFYFAVPNRLLWDNWQALCGESKTGGSEDYLVPMWEAPAGGWLQSDLSGRLADYIGAPLGKDNADISALYPRAYDKIYQEWFRDQNLMASFTEYSDDGPDAAADHSLHNRGKRHDYFTSCLPWPQKGTAIDLPLGSSAPVVGDGRPIHLVDANDVTGFNLFNSTFSSGGQDLRTSNQNLSNLGDATSGAGSAIHDLALGLHATQDSGMIADLTNATAATINSLREAFQLQRMLERDARGGTRYTEIIRSHFGVISPDARMQRPEYLGGSSQRLNVTPVPQTNATGATGTPQGNLAGYGVVADSNGGFVKSFTEHCIIMGIACIRHDLSYQQGLPRHLTRRTRWSYYWPSLANLGEQDVRKKEIYFNNDSHDNEVFGYQERYAEYRYYPNRISGQLRSTASVPLDSWHLADFYQALPVLDDGSWIEVNGTNLDRVSAVKMADDEPQFKFDSYFDLKCARPMPVFSVPGLIDHF